MIVRGTMTDLQLESALPFINKVMTESEKTVRPVGPSLFNMRSSTRAIEQVTGYTGLGQLRHIAEGADVEFDDPVQGFDKTFRHEKYGLGFSYSAETLEDGKHGVIQRMSRELGRSDVDTRETQMASVFNLAFSGSQAGPDGQPLCSASHPLPKHGGVTSNLLSVPAALSISSLQLGLTQMRKWLSASGKPLHIEPRALLIPVDTEWTASEILNSALRADTANNTTNAFKHRIGAGAFETAMIWRYLTSTTAWFIVAAPEDTGLVWYWRKRPYTKANENYRNETAEVAKRYRASFGFEDWVGVFGTPGA